MARAPPPCVCVCGEVYLALPQVCGKGAWNEPGLNAKGEWIEGNWMLLCDGCDTARHTLCCWPALLAVREGGKEREGEARGTAGTWQ